MQENPPRPDPAAPEPATPTPQPAPLPPADPPQPPLAVPPFLEARVAGATRVDTTPPPPFVPDQVDPAYIPLTLTVGTGFKFGCGFLLAMMFAALLLFLVLSVIFFIASLMGLPLPLVTQ